MADAAGQDVWVGFDLGGTKMLAQAYDNDFKLLGKDRRKTSSVSIGTIRNDDLVRTNSCERSPQM